MALTEWDTATAVLRLSAQLVEDIQLKVTAAGFSDVRPVHGFVFGILAAGPLSTTDLADQLGVSKQAAGQLVEHLERRGYLTKEADPHDKRARRLVMTERGRACTQAAARAAADTVVSWRKALTKAQAAGFDAALAALARPGRLRPAW